MTPEERAARLSALRVDIDTRLVGLYATIWREGSPLLEALGDTDTADAIGAALRLAYAIGHEDALTSGVDDLARTNGYAPARGH